MRPDRFENVLRSLLATADGVTAVQTVREAGYERHPRGLVVTYATGARVLLQITATRRPGDDLSQPETIMEGDTAPAEVPVPELYQRGKLQLDAVDRHIVALVLNSGSREVASAEAYSTREKPRAVRYGATITYHDTSIIRVYVVQALPAGRELQSDREFDVPAAV